MRERGEFVFASSGGKRSVEIVIACVLCCAAFAVNAEDAKPAEKTPAPPSPTVPPAPKKDDPTPKEKSEKENPAPDAPVVQPAIVVEGRADDLIGGAKSASEGIVGAKQIEARPISRVGEVLETVPGLIVTQHSGAGKANQYFFRGFNLDHGTDFATWIAGMPVNMPSHGHGQGYTDINFMIPEMVQSVEYRKGPYYAAEGDFGTTGAAHINYFKKLPQNIVELTGGSWGYGRFLLAGSPKLKSGNLVGAIELQHADGPWTHSENVRKVSGVLSYSQGDATEGWSVTGMGYSNAWNSTDQVAKRAVKDGTINRFNALDPSDGGRSMRYSLSGEWHRESAESETRINAYVIEYQMNLFSNFTYFLDDPVNGDQFEQQDKRIVAGAYASHTWHNTFLGRPCDNTIGLNVRHDRVDGLGLYHVQHRSRLETVRQDDVLETSISPYFENSVQWLEKLRTITGFRADAFLFDVNSDNTANSGAVTAGIVNPKLSIVMGPWDKTEYYVNLGMGYHSNDARGTTTTVDPKSGDDVKVAPPLVRVKGSEFGIRTTYIPHLNSSLSFFQLDADSELVFVGDAGTVEASRPSRRLGAEFANYYTPLKWLTFDLDISVDRARFLDSDPAGKRIPGAIESVIATGVAVDHNSGFFGALRLRYFGPRPLIEDNSERSSSTSLVSGRLGYKFNKHARVTLEGFNLLNRKDSDIDYFYTSRLKNEPAEGKDDVHFKPVEPLSFRLGVTVTW